MTGGLMGGPDPAPSRRRRAPLWLRRRGSYATVGEYLEATGQGARRQRMLALCDAVEEAGRQELALIEELRQEPRPKPPLQLPARYYPGAGR